VSMKKKITPGLFQAIKRLQKDGASPKEVMQYFSLSDSTVYRIFRCETLDEYENECLQRTAEMRAMNAKKGEPESQPVPEKEVRHTVEMVANHYFMQEMKEQTRILNLIQNKLTAIIDDLYGTGVKKE